MDLLTLVLAGVGGVFAGFLTTVAGVGGGLALIAALSGFTPLDPKEVVVLTAPVLLVGNAQRAVAYRRSIDRPVTAWFLVGGVPAAIGGAALLPYLPARAIQIGIALLLLAFVGERIVRRGTSPAVTVGVRPFAVVGLVTGVLSATVGGSGPFSAPFFSGHGLTRHGFVATNAACNGTQHAVKVATYVATGLLTWRLAPVVAIATAAVVVGNTVGGVVLGRISEEMFVRLLLVALTVAAIRLLLP